MPTTWIWIHKLRLSLHIDYLFGNEHFNIVDLFIRNDHEEASLSLYVCAFGISIGVFK